MMRREQLLFQWADKLSKDIVDGKLGDSLEITQIKYIPGPRAGVLKFFCPAESLGKLKKMLSKDDCAVVRPYVPWDFPVSNRPAVFMEGKYLRVEAPWSDDLAEKNIPLKTLVPYPHGRGQWVAGRSERGATVVLGVDDVTPGWLIAGATGSGKSEAELVAISQLCLDPDNQLVLIDAKQGDGLRPVANVQNMIGPMALDVQSARAALSWVVSEMRRRLAMENKPKDRIIVFIDEIQPLFEDKDVCAMLTQRIVAQGRAAKVFCVICTWYPLQEIFKNRTTRPNLNGRVALYVKGAEASRVVVGDSTPRADRLVPPGDAYCIAPSATHRTQLAYLTPGEKRVIPTAEPRMLTWPAISVAEAVGALPGVKVVENGFSPRQEALALIAAAVGEKGRPTLRKMLEKEGVPIGSSARLSKLLTRGRDVHTELTGFGCRITSNLTKDGNVV